MDLGRVFVAGSINMDVVATAERHPKVGETVAGKAVLYFPGGKGANQAVAAARLGAPTTLIGRVGEDAFGQELRAFLAAQGVDLTFVKDPEAHTGTAIITVANADNTIVVVPGANAMVERRRCRGTGSRKRRRRGEPIRNSASRDRRLLQASSRRRRDHDPQSRAGDANRRRVARPRRYPHPQRNRTRLLNGHRVARQRRSRPLHRRGAIAAPTGQDRLRHAGQARRGGADRRRAAGRPRPRGQGRRHHWRRRLFCRCARRAAGRRLRSAMHCATPTSPLRSACNGWARRRRCRRRRK